MTFISIASGQVVSGGTVTSGQKEIVHFGGLIIDTLVSGPKAALLILEGGVASGTTLSNGNLTVNAGGILSGAVVAKGGVVYLAGSGSDIVVSRGGFLDIASGANVAGLTNDGGSVFHEAALSGQTVSGDVAEGRAAYQTVQVGGSAIGTRFVAGGGQVVSGVAVGTVMKGGVKFGALQTVISGGRARGTALYSGAGIQVVYGGTATGTTIGSGANGSVYFGGRMSLTEVRNGGTESVGTGGTAVFATVDSGGMIVFAGGIVVGLTVLRGGKEAIGNGTAMTDLKVPVGVTLLVSSGGTAIGAVIDQSSLEQDRGLASNTTVLSGGTEAVRTGGIATGTTVSGGGAVTVYGGGLVDGIVVSSGGGITVSAGAIAGDIVLSGGTETVQTGAHLVGTTQFAGPALLSATAKTALALRVAGFGAADRIDLTGFGNGAGLKHSFVENKSKTQGILTLTEGGRTARITLFGQYVAAGFNFASDGHGGTVVTYAAPHSGAVQLAAAHGA